MYVEKLKQKLEKLCSAKNPSSLVHMLGELEWNDVITSKEHRKLCQPIYRLEKEIKAKIEKFDGMTDKEILLKLADEMDENTLEKVITKSLEMLDDASLASLW